MTTKDSKKSNQVKKKRTRAAATRKTSGKTQATKTTKTKTATRKKTTAKQKTTATQKKSKKTTTKTIGTKKTVNNKQTAENNVQKSDEVVILPDSVSQRSLEKSILVRMNWNEGIQLFMYYLAYVSAFVFMLVGSAILLADTFGYSALSDKNMLATVNQPLTDNKTQTVYRKNNHSQSTLSSTDTSHAQLAQGGVSITFSNVPSRVEGDFDTSFLVYGLTSTDKVKAFVTNTRTPLVSELKVKKSGDNKFSASVPMSFFPAGYYRLNVIVLRNGSTLASSNSTEFKSGSDEAVAEELSKIKNDNSLPSKLNINSSNFYFKTPSGTVVNKVARIDLQASKYLPYVDLYATSVTTGKKTLLTRGGRSDGNSWFFSFDSRNLANGKYYLTAISRYGNQTFQTKQLLVTISNSALDRKTFFNNPTKSKKPVEVFEKTIKTDLSDDDFDQINSSVKKASNELLLENKEEIEDLTRKYLAAVSNKDEASLKRLETDFANIQKDIVLTAKRRQDTKDIADNIEKQLQSQITKIKEKIEIFEKINKNRDDVKTDTDGDGVTDYDEVNLYGTDPENADTDGDGLDDGSELLQQTSPLTKKATIKFESPKQTLGLTRDDILQVTKVEFSKQMSKTENETVNKNNGDSGSDYSDDKRLTISGSAPPNSFVTLFIYSLPTVVTIKTNDAGDFTYIFDKELEDGKHDVYVAITNSNGNILAQSDTFSFVKKAQAVSFVDDVSVNNALSENYIDTETKKTYRSVIGISILTFGLILLMLGISLRPKKKIITENIIAD